MYFWEDRASLDVGSRVMEVEQKDWGWVFTRKDRGQMIPEGDVVVEEVRQPLAAIFLFGFSRYLARSASRWCIQA